VNNMLITSDRDRYTILLKRKRKYYQQHVNSEYKWDENSGGAPKATEHAVPQPPSSAQPTPPAGNAEAPASRTQVILLSYLELFGNICVVLFTALYIIPGSWMQEISDFCFCWVLRIVCVNTVLYFFRQHGRPKFTPEFGRRLAYDDSLHYGCMAFVLMLAPPFFFGILPFALRSVVFCSEAMKMIFRNFVPFLHRLLGPILQQVIDKKSECMDVSVFLEVAIGLLLLIQLPTPQRNFTLCLIYWQFLRMRYMLSSYSRRAFSATKLGLDRMFLGPTTWCPRVIGSVYSKVINWISAIGEPTQSPSCSIM